MFKNYLKVAFRNLVRGKIYTFINVAGLSVGIACCVLILLYVSDEWSFDQFHAKSDNIYRAWTKEQMNGEVFFNTVTPFPLAAMFEEHVPEVEAICQVVNMNDLVKVGEFSASETVHLVSDDFWEMFDFEVIEGTTPKDLHEIVVTPSIAEKYFKRQSPIGQNLAIRMGEDFQNFTVSGIVAAPPSNSSLQFNLLIPFDHAKTIFSQNALTSWFIIIAETYVLLRDGVTAEMVEAKLPSIIDPIMAKDFQPGEYTAGLQPLKDIHLNTDYPVGMVAISDARYSYILSGIAFLILLLACINFMSLSIGRSVSRAKEVSVRKVVGAKRWHLMQQFWSEAILVTFFAAIVGLLLAELLLPTFNQLANKSLTLQLSLGNLSILAALTLFIGMVSGSYPALVLSGFSPIQILRGVFSKTGKDKHLVLRGMIAFQFALSVVLIVCTVVMQKQLNHLQNKNLGFDKEQVVVLPYSATPTPDKGLLMIIEEGKEKAELLKNELKGNPAIQSITAATHSFGNGDWLRLGYTDANDGKFRRFSVNAITHNYFETMGIELVEGRFFDESMATDDTTAVIINESMAKTWGWENPIGQTLPKPFDSQRIIGVVKDFHFSSLHTPIGPLAMVINPAVLLQVTHDLTFEDDPAPDISIKIASENIPAVLEDIKTAWANVAPEQSFNYAFLDDAIDRQYQQESRLGNILHIATLLAIFIACLGLFGIATLTIARKTKEIGVRKILGATVSNITLLLTKEFAALVLIANLIACPIAYYVMSNWLQNFAYTTSISWWIFGLAATLSLVIAMITVSFQAVQAAFANPVKALRYE